MAVTLGLARWFGWTGLIAAFAASFALLVSIAHMQGESWGSDSTNPIVRTACTGAFWAWVAGFWCAVALFVAWCRRNLKVANQ